MEAGPHPSDGQFEPLLTDERRVGEDLAQPFHLGDVVTGD